jgi:hypothetical protein
MILYPKELNCIKSIRVGVRWKQGKPLYIELDEFGKRYVVKDDEGNVVFLTDFSDEEPYQTATLAAMKLGGWLKGRAKRVENFNDLQSTHEKLETRR